LKVKVEPNDDDYISCQILFDKDRKKAWMGQPHLLKKIEKSYAHIIAEAKKVSTPGTKKFNTVRTTCENEKVSLDEQKVYRAAVGSLLNLIKYSRPDVENVVRELSKCKDGATYAAFKELKRALRFVLDTKV
jgi:hypothetical protein